MAKVTIELSHADFKRLLKLAVDQESTIADTAKSLILNNLRKNKKHVNKYAEFSKTDPQEDNKWWAPLTHLWRSDKCKKCS